MKNKMMGVIQLVLSIIVLILFNGFYWKVLSLLGLHLTGDAYTIANFIKYLFITMIVFVIYYRNIKAGKNRFNKSFFNSLIYCVSCFVFLIVITIVLHELINYIGASHGISVSYNFTNYFSSKFTLSSALNLVIDAIFMPFLLCIIFPLGCSNIFKKQNTAAFVSGIAYGIIYAINLNTSIERAIFLSLTPAIIVAALTYLYKNNGNIWSVIVTHICYVLFGIFAINYII